jgi:D-alanyl-D-alanine dipeptidase
MAIDLTICDSTGLALDMGTEFDFFGDLAFPDKTDSFYQTGQLSSEQFKNRKLLLNIMAKAGFYVSKTEWWHYNASSLDYAKGKYKIFSYDDK